MHSQSDNSKNNRLLGILITASLILITPLVAMQFTDEVNWSGFDFLIIGVLLFGAGVICELVLRKVKALRHRFALCAAVLIVFFLIWAELAVGIFGTPFAGS
ncbi:MAG: hypothetical protein JNK00_13550 [Flavipsychrobacter sp.]|nr:hypothetical protein [Flavipsychrobacter sp.]